MTEQTEIQKTSVVQSINVPIEVDKNDIVAVAVTRHESLLEKRRTAIEKTLRDLRSAQTTLLADLQTAAKAQIATTFMEPLEALRTQLVEWGFEGAVTKTDAVNLNTKSRKINANFEIRASDRTYCDTLSSWKEVDVCDDISDMIDKLEAVNKKIEKAANINTEVRRALRNIDRVERHARAALAEQTLRATEDGEAFLATMDNLESPFYGLLALDMPEEEGEVIDADAS